MSVINGPKQMTENVLFFEELISIFLLLVLDLRHINTGSVFVCPDAVCAQQDTKPRFKDCIFQFQCKMIDSQTRSVLLLSLIFPSVFHQTY